MTFKLKSDTICIIRFALEEIYYLKSAQTEAYKLSRPTLFVLTKKFINKQLQLYKELPINTEKLYKMNFEIHEAVLLKGIVLQLIQEIDNHYSAVLLNNFINDLHNQTIAF
jgi:hypothetical protein